MEARAPTTNQPDTLLATSWAKTAGWFFLFLLLGAAAIYWWFPIVWGALLWQQGLIAGGMVGLTTGFGISISRAIQQETDPSVKGVMEGMKKGFPCSGAFSVVLLSIVNVAVSAVYVGAVGVVALVGWILGYYKGRYDQNRTNVQNNDINEVDADSATLAIALDYATQSISGRAVAEQKSAMADLSELKNWLKIIQAKAGVPKESIAIGWIENMAIHPRAQAAYSGFAFACAGGAGVFQFVTALKAVPALKLAALSLLGFGPTCVLAGLMVVVFCLMYHSEWNSQYKLLNTGDHDQKLARRKHGQADLAKSLLPLLERSPGADGRIVAPDIEDLRSRLAELQMSGPPRPGVQDIATMPQDYSSPTRGTFVRVFAPTSDRVIGTLIRNDTDATYKRYANHELVPTLGDNETAYVEAEPLTPRGRNRDTSKPIVIRPLQSGVFSPATLLTPLPPAARSAFPSSSPR